jgi:hypothetical protein
MTGTIAHTNRNGGAIKPSDHAAALVVFSWPDCIDFGPLDVGYGVNVQYYVEIVNHRERAIAVKRVDAKGK